ncbi:hypothetical protein D3C72_2445130 [compost metagenome]
MKLVEMRISDRRILKLTRKGLNAGVMEERKVKALGFGYTAGRGHLAPLSEHLPELL